MSTAPNSTISGISTSNNHTTGQQGINEHCSGRIRRYLARQTRFDDLTQGELDEYAAEINNRPRKILGRFTPPETLRGLHLTHPYHDVLLL